MLFLRRGGIILNRKKISRLIAGALATSVVVNSSHSDVESVHAITKDIYSEFSEGHGLEDDSDENSDDSDANENTTDNSGTNLPELSGVSIEQMQRDFEGFSNVNEVNLLSDGDDSCPLAYSKGQRNIFQYFLSRNFYSQVFYSKLHD